MRETTHYHIICTKKVEKTLMGKHYQKTYATTHEDADRDILYACLEDLAHEYQIPIKDFEVFLIPKKLVKDHIIEGNLFIDKLSLSQMRNAANFYW